MRVTNRMIHENALRGLMQGAEGMQAARERVLDAKRLHRPSDDPIGVTNAIKLRDAMGEMDQFLRNIGAAERTLGAAETALSSATDIVQRARELAIQAANSWPSPGDRQLIAPEVEHLARQLASLASAKIGDAYLFSGFRTDVAPYAPPPPGSADAGAYLGDAGAVIARVSPGITLQVNVTADSAFGPALAALKQLHDELTAGTAVTPGRSSSSTPGSTRCFGRAPWSVLAPTASRERASHSRTRSWPVDGCCPRWRMSTSPKRSPS